MPDDCYTGGCLCSAIRYSVSGSANSCCFCHCESCRRASGGASVPWVTVSAGEFSISEGELTLHRSSDRATRGFCARCGTSLTYQHSGRPDEVDIALVSFDDPGAFTPTCHIWVADKLPWVAIDDGLPQHQTWASADAD